MKNLIVYSLISILSCSQTQLETCKYPEYYKEISNALLEKHSNNDWAKANEIFKSAFKKVKTPLGTDLEEALEVSIKIKDENQVESITEKLLIGGIPIKYFNQYPSIIKSDWWKEIEIIYPKIEKEYPREYDVELLDKLISLRTQDSLFNIEFHQFRKGEKQFELNYLVEKAEGIYNGFKELESNHGFPSEINTGYYYRDNKIQILPTQIVLIHIHQLGESIIENEFKYKEVVCNGHLTEYSYDVLRNIKSLGGGKGIEHAMKIFYEKYKKNN